MPEEERKISPAVIIPVGLGLAGLLGIFALACAALPGVYPCPYCEATFPTEEELNEHIQTEHPEAPPAVEVSNLVISPEEVAAGEAVTISCTVTNNGAEAADYTVLLGGDFMAEQVVELAPGEAKQVSFEVTPTEIKAYSVSVNGLTGSFSVFGVADIRVENLVIEPTEVMIGNPVTISVTATNYGTAAGSKTIICTVA